MKLSDEVMCGDHVAGTLIWVQCSFYYIIFEAWTIMSMKDVKIEHVDDRQNKRPV